jgi:glycosyltransferase involved in cell wall biosynthesis
MLISIIICTIRRAGLLRELLACLERQTYRGLEILIVGGPDPAEGRQYEALANCLPLRFITAGKGLARARNAGLAQARGDIVCFLDDDVRIGTDFFALVASTFRNPEMADVGGLTGYDVLNYAYPVPPAWKLRRLLGITPSLEPGFCTALGRSVPFAFLMPFSGFRQVQWLPGFCQIFRRTAIGDLRYDEHERIVDGFRGIAVEDRDLSMNVGLKWRLLVLGDLKIEHRRDQEARAQRLPMTWRACYGLGRSFAMRSRSAADRVRALHVVLGEFIVDLLTAIVRPSVLNFKLPWMRAHAFVAGYLSAKSKP